MGIEPTSVAWEATALPLSYTRCFRTRTRQSASRAENVTRSLVGREAAVLPRRSCGHLAHPSWRSAGGGFARRAHVRWRLVPAHGRPRLGAAEDVPGGVGVPIVPRTTADTHPLPHNQPADSAWTAQASTRRTGDAGIRFGDDRKRPGSLLALVFQEVFEHPQATVEQGLGHPCLSKLGDAQIAHNDLLISIDDFPTELVQGIATAAGCAAM